MEVRNTSTSKRVLTTSNSYRHLLNLNRKSSYHLLYLILLTTSSPTKTLLPLLRCESQFLKLLATKPEPLLLVPLLRHGGLLIALLAVWRHGKLDVQWGLRLHVWRHRGNGGDG